MLLTEPLLSEKQVHLSQDVSGGCPSPHALLKLLMPYIYACN